MKTRLLVMVGMMISTTIFAQRAGRDSRKPENNGYERMKRELALSDEQVASVKGIHSKYSKKRDEQRTKFSRERFEDRETMRTLRLEREREVRKIFTPDQNKRWDELQGIKKGKHHFHPANRKHGGHRHPHKHDRRNERRD